MHTWSKIRKKLEQEYLADSLRGRLTYFVTAYHAAHDSDEGRAAIRLDGAEILKSNFFERMDRQWEIYSGLGEAQNEVGAWRQSGLDAIHDGAFYQVDFYRAFSIFDNQSIGESLQSDNALVRMFALLDRRTGKRTLEKLRSSIGEMPDWLQMIYYIRLEAEQMPLTGKEQQSMKKAILFDLDGTLWDSSEQVTHAWNKTIREKTNRTEQFTVADLHNFMGRTMEAIAALMFPDLPDAERIAILEYCAEDEIDYLTHPVPGDEPLYFPDEEAIIRALAKDYTLGIVSNCQEGYIETYLGKIPFADAFTDIECAGRTGKSKGENIRLVVERQGITDCIYVGDTQGDADAAYEAGVKFVHAAYGFGKVRACDAALDDIRKLPQTVKEIFEEA